MWSDFHTHNLNAVPGTAIVNLPQAALENPQSFSLVEGGIYSVGIHPWWTVGDLDVMWRGLEFWIRDPQVVALGECGLDKLKGADLLLQEACFLRQVSLSENLHKPLTIHCVKAYDRLLELHKAQSPKMVWTIHGFRGKPALARQLLDCGFNLSFGKYFNADSWALTPSDRRYRETDDDW